MPRTSHLPDPVLGSVPRLQRRHEPIDLGPGAESRAIHHLVQVCLREDRTDQPERGEAKLPFAERALEHREPAQDAHGGDAAAGRALPQVERLQTEVPERGVAGLEVAARVVEGFEVEEEVGLDAPLVAGELAEAAGQSGGVERGDGRRDDDVHGPPRRRGPCSHALSGSPGRGLAASRMRFRRKGSSPPRARRSRATPPGWARKELDFERRRERTTESSRTPSMTIDAPGGLARRSVRLE
jgi:hypothetical protein